jgi:hypothetical protein
MATAHPVEQTARSPQAGVLTRRLAPAAVAPLVGLLLAAPSFVWASVDRSIWPWDPAWYGETSVDLWATLRHNHYLWPKAMQHALGIKPPGIAWFGQFFVPLGGVLGSEQTALLVFQVLVQAASLAFLYAAARRVDGRPFSIAAGVVLTASAPLFVSLSHDYFVEPLQTLSVVWVLFIMVSARRWHPSLTLAQLVAALAFGLLAKLATPLYQAAPAAVAVALSLPALRSRAWGRWWLEKRFLASAVLAAVLAYGAGRWYEVNFDAAWPTPSKIRASPGAVSSATTRPSS